MDKPKTDLHVGKRLRHELTGQEIKLMNPHKDGWRVAFLSAPIPPGHIMYDAYLDTHTLAKNYLEVEE